MGMIMCSLKVLLGTVAESVERRVRDNPADKGTNPGHFYNI